MSHSKETVPLTITTLCAEATLPLRHQLLRPHQGIEQCRYPGDEEAQTRHFGARYGEQEAGIVSIYHVPCPNFSGQQGWQLRALTTLPELRQRGIGRSLLETAVTYAQAQGADLVWCNARIAALDFYQHNGFITMGEPIEITDIGPHYLMVRQIEPSQ
ncbi:GNAT family N-acetyltransferase [Candidatus Reidiella endopervernicosa]|uniref:GNAT family N-acetyltransferase n=1 Tax=Candidatus Reidiella endopervernicosa TaxID=2738883 RepID=A0A6N0HZH0_9GAMM|nr:GNAT family N-acetyltransferase [Candidatus Reidiella endopervernicosa]QKQ27773.1 GNAT family N-acetyltransferase [Candidatus Reidiella endopervernicosa]